MYRSLWIAMVFVISTSTTLAIAQLAEPTDDEIRHTIIRECRAIYHERRRCACPDDHDIRGVRCGRRSAYVKPGGASPFCRPEDITDNHLARYRAGDKVFMDQRCIAPR